MLVAEAPGGEPGETPRAGGTPFRWHLSPVMGPCPLFTRAGQAPGTQSHSPVLNMAWSCGETLRWPLWSISRLVAVGLQSRGLHSACDHSPATPRGRAP